MYNKNRKYAVDIAQARYSAYSPYVKCWNLLVKIDIILKPPKTLKILIKGFNCNFSI